MPVPDGVSMPELLAALRRRRRVAGIAAGACGLLALAVVYGPSPVFVAEARLLVEPARQTLPFAGDPAATPQVDNGQLNTQRDLLLSTGVLGAALGSGALAGSTVYDGAQDPAQVLLGRLDIQAPRETWVLVLRLRDEDPRRAERGLQAVVDAYLAARSRLEDARATETVAFLRRQAEESARALALARQEVQDYRLANHIFSDDAERSFATQRIQALQGKRVVAREQVVALRALVQQTDDAADAGPGALEALLAVDAVNRHPVIMEQVKLLYDFQTREADLAQKYLERHPRLIELRQQIQAKRKQILDTAEQVRLGLHAERDKLEAALASLERTIASEEDELNRYKEALVRLEALTERVRTQAALQEQLLRRLGEEEVASRLNATSVRLADPPRAGPRAVNRWGVAALVLAALAAAGGGVGAALLAERLDRRVRGSNAASALGVPVLAIVPASPAGIRWAAGVSGERLRNLRTAVHHVLPAKPGRGLVLAVVAAAGSDHAALALGLAEVEAASGARTLLVDGDLRQPSLAAALGLDPAPGLAALLAGEPEIAAQATPVAGLDAMAVGEAPANPAELLNSHCLAEWLGQCRESYDLVILGTSALDGCADAVIAAAQADAVLWALADGTPLARLDEALAVATPLRGRLVGGVLIEAADA